MNVCFIKKLNVYSMLSTYDTQQWQEQVQKYMY